VGYQNRVLRRPRQIDRASALGRQAITVEARGLFVGADDFVFFAAAFNAQRSESKHYSAFFYLAACLAHLGRLDQSAARG
jgi:hypothetical protein